MSAARLHRNPHPAIIAGQAGRDAFDRGVETLTRAIAARYGPSARLVGNAGATPTSAPEFLADGATIARRIVEVSPRAENAGLMFLLGNLRTGALAALAAGDIVALHVAESEPGSLQVLAVTSTGIVEWALNGEVWTIARRATLDIQPTCAAFTADAILIGTISGDIRVIPLPL